MRQYSTTNRNLIRKWYRWLERIKNEIITLAIRRATYREVREIVIANPAINIGNPFHDLIISGYVGYAASSIRRLTDMDKWGKSVSLAGLLREILKHPQALTRRRMMRLYHDSRLPPRIADNHMDASERMTRTRINKGRIRADLAYLRKITSKIKAYVDKIVAHTDRRAPRSLPTYQDLDSAIDRIEEMTRRYIFLLDGSYQAKFLPALHPEWKSIFKAPWIQEELAHNPQTMEATSVGSA